MLYVQRIGEEMCIVLYYIFVSCVVLYRRGGHVEDDINPALFTKLSRCIYKSKLLSVNEMMQYVQNVHCACTSAARHSQQERTAGHEHNLRSGC